MQLTTSKRISLKFTLYTMAIVFFFWFLVNISSFQQWYSAENTRLTNKWMMQTPPNKGWHRASLPAGMRLPWIEEIPYSEQIFSLLQEHIFFLNIVEVDDQYLMFKRTDTTIKLCNVTWLVESQQKMILIFVFLLVLFSLGTYFLSLVFVRSSLKDIHRLVAYVKKLTIHTLHEPVPLSWPADDEIRIIGQSLQETLTTIKEQTDSLKDFVTHASHELKTPLMSLSAVIDAGQKTGNHEKAFAEAKTSLKSINTLFETLLSITKWEYQKIKTAPLDIVPVMQHLLGEVQKNYKKKLITCEVQLPKTYVLETNEDMFRIIFLNLVENAYKYTPDKWSIGILLSATDLSITNSGPGITPEKATHIRDKFWKDHSKQSSKEGFGLGLYLVQLLVNKHRRSIHMKSVPDQFTTFSINFKA